MNRQQQDTIKSKFANLDFSSKGPVALGSDADTGDFKGYSFLNRTETVVVGGKAAPLKDVHEENLGKIDKRKPSMKKATTVNVKKGQVSTTVVKQEAKEKSVAKKVVKKPVSAKKTDRKAPPAKKGGVASKQP